MYLTGGLNHECNKEIAQLKFTNDGQTQWTNIPYYSNDKIIGRCRHTSCAYNDKVYMFGGCFMFNMKRQIRECTSQLVIYDTIEDTLNIIKTRSWEALAFTRLRAEGAHKDGEVYPYSGGPSSFAAVLLRGWTPGSLITGACFDRPSCSLS